MQSRLSTAGLLHQREYFVVTWEEKFVRFITEEWVFKGTDPHDFTPRTVLLGFGHDFLSPRLKKHRHFGALYTGFLEGRLVGYMRVPPGTVVMEGVIRSLQFTRVDTLIGLGTCGGLQEDIDCGDIIVADASQAGDCLSPHYGFKPNDLIPGDAGLARRLGGFLRRRGLKVHNGPIVTTGAVLRESEELIRSWNRAGFLGVELEASALFAIADFMGMKSTFAFLVSDNPARGEIANVRRGATLERFLEGITAFAGSPELPA